MWHCTWTSHVICDGYKGHIAIQYPLTCLSLVSCTCVYTAMRVVWCVRHMHVWTGFTADCVACTWRNSSHDYKLPCIIIYIHVHVYIVCVEVVFQMYTHLYMYTIHKYNYVCTSCDSELSADWSMPAPSSHHPALCDWVLSAYVHVCTAHPLYVWVSGSAHMHTNYCCKSALCHTPLYMFTYTYLVHVYMYVNMYIHVLCIIIIHVHVHACRGWFQSAIHV